MRDRDSSMVDREGRGVGVGFAAPETRWVRSRRAPQPSTAARTSEAPSPTRALSSGGGRTRGVCQALLACCAVFWSAGSALALEPAPRPLEEATVRSPWEVSLGAQLAYGLSGSRCERTASDVIECSALGLVAFELAPRYRWAHLSAGALLQLGKASSVSLLRFGAEARFHPSRSNSVDPWLGADAGVAVLVDALPMGELGPAESFSTVAPALGVSLGLDFALGETVSLGVLSRVTWLALGGQDDLFDRKPSYDSQWLVSLGLAGTYRF